MSAECMYYNAFEGANPTGPLRLMPPLDPVPIIGAGQFQPYYGHEGVPLEMPQALNFNANVLVARLVRMMEAMNFDLSDDQVQEWNDQISKLLDAELDDLGADSLLHAVYDPDERAVGREVVNLLQVTGPNPPLIVASSARADISPGTIEPDEARNLIVLGGDGDSLANVFVGTGIIRHRTDTNGHTATLGGFDETVIRSLAVVPTIAAATGTNQRLDE
jgi:hypothetical protein